MNVEGWVKVKIGFRSKMIQNRDSKQQKVGENIS